MAYSPKDFNIETKNTLAKEYAKKKLGILDDPIDALADVKPEIKAPPVVPQPSPFRLESRPELQEIDTPQGKRVVDVGYKQQPLPEPKLFDTKVADEAVANEITRKELEKVNPNAQPPTAWEKFKYKAPIIKDPEGGGELDVGYVMDAGENLRNASKTAGAAVYKNIASLARTAQGIGNKIEDAAIGVSKISPPNVKVGSEPSIGERPKTELEQVVDRSDYISSEIKKDNALWEATHPKEAKVAEFGTDLLTGLVTVQGASKLAGGFTKGLALLNAAEKASQPNATFQDVKEAAATGALAGQALKVAGPTRVMQGVAMGAPVALEKYAEGKDFISAVTDPDTLTNAGVGFLMGRGMIPETVKAPIRTAKQFEYARRKAVLGGEPVGGEQLLSDPTVGEIVKGYGGMIKNSIKDIFKTEPKKTPTKYAMPEVTPQISAPAKGSVTEPPQKSTSEVLYHKIGNNNIEIIKNPSPSDYRQIDIEFKKEFPNAKQEPSTRTTYDSDGNKYIWRSDRAAHSDVEPFIINKFGVEANQNKYFSQPPKKSVGAAGQDNISDAIPLRQLPQEPLKVKTEAGEKVTITPKPGEAFSVTPFQTAEGKIKYELHDGDSYIIPKNTAQDLTNRFGMKPLDISLPKDLEVVRKKSRARPEAEVIKLTNDADEAWNQLNEYRLSTIKNYGRDRRIWPQNILDNEKKLEDDYLHKKDLLKYDNKSETKYSLYQLEKGQGSKNYREVLFKEPHNPPQLPPKILDAEIVDRGSQGVTDMAQRYALMRGDEILGTGFTPENAQRQGTARYNEQLDKNNRVYRSHAYGGIPKNFGWNRLAEHNVAELPEGYRLRKGDDGFYVESSSGKETVVKGDTTYIKNYGYGKTEGEAVLNFQRMRNATGGGKQTTLLEETQHVKPSSDKITEEQYKNLPEHAKGNKFYEMSLKHALKEAVDAGSDSLSWVTGEQTADRYDLSKQIDRIAYKQNDNGSYSVDVFDHSGDVTGIGWGDMSMKDIEQTLGKDVAKKIQQGVGEPAGAVFRGEPVKEKILKGLNLKMGGEWAVNLYDKQIPNILKDLTKGYNTKFQDITLENGKTVHSMTITPELREAISGDKGTVGAMSKGARADEQSLEVTTKQELTPKEKEISKSFYEDIKNNLQERIRSYRQTFKNVFSTDNAREFSNDYSKDKTTRTIYSRATQDGAQLLSRESFNQAINEPTPAGFLPEVVGMAGGTGVGKSTIIDSNTDIKNSHAILDSNMADFDSAKKHIERVLRAGKKFRAVFVYRDPLESFINGVIPRAMDKDAGRMLSADYHLNAHFKSPEVFLRLSKNFSNNKDVSFNVIDNSLGKGNAKPENLAFLQKLVDTRTQEVKNEITKQTYEALERAYKEGTITPEVYYAGRGDVQRAIEEAGRINVSQPEQLGLQQERGRVEAQRPVQLPEEPIPQVRPEPKTPSKEEDLPQRGFAETVETTEPDPNLKRELEDMVYPVQHHEVTIAAGDQILKDNIAEAHRMVNSKDAGPVEQYVGMKLAHAERNRVREYLAIGDEVNAAKHADEFINLINKVSSKATVAGQANEILKLWSEADPITFVRLALNNKLQAKKGRVNQTIEQLKNRDGLMGVQRAEVDYLEMAKKRHGIVLSPKETTKILEMADKITNAKTEEEKILATHETMAYINQITPATWMDKILEARAALFLTGLKTHIVNITGQGMQMGLQLASTPISASIELAKEMGSRAMGHKYRRERFFGETTRLMKGYIDSFPTAARMAIKGFQASWEGMPLESSKIDIMKAPAIKGTKGKVIRIPFHALSGADAGFTTMNKFAWTSALAYRQAMYEKSNGKLKESIDERADYLMKNPSEFLDKLSSEMAMEIVYKQPLGPAAKKVGEIREQKDILGYAAKWNIPFFQTPINVPKTMVEYSPFAVLSPKFWKRIKEGGGESSDAMSRAILGSVIMAGITALALQDDKDGIPRITGGPSRDKTERTIQQTLGIPYYSFRLDIKGKRYWVSWQRTPFALLFNGAAEIARAYREWNDKTLSELLWTSAVNSGKMIVDQPFLTGINDTLNAILDPDRYGETYLQRQAGSMTPAIVRQTERAMDLETREPKGYKNAILSGIPWAAETLKPKRDLWGEKVKRKPLWGKEFTTTSRTADVANVIINPFPIQKGKERDPASMELYRLRVVPAMPTDKIAGLKLNETNFDKYQMYTGKEAKEVIDKLIDTGSYRNSTPEEKRSLLKKAYNKVKATVAKDFFNRQITLDLEKLQDAPPLEKHQYLQSLIDNGTIKMETLPNGELMAEFEGKERGRLVKSRPLYRNVVNTLGIEDFTPQPKIRSREPEDFYDPEIEITEQGDTE